MKYEIGKQVLLLVGAAHREVVITGRAEYLRGADQYLVEDTDPDSQRGAFWVEEPGLAAKDGHAVAAEDVTDADTRYSPEHRVDFSKADRDYKTTGEPTTRGFFVGDRVIHAKYGGGVVIGNINGHTEVRFYDEDKRQVFIGSSADELMLASFAEAAAAQVDKSGARDQSLIGDRIFGELATFDSIDGICERIITVFADRGYSMNLSFHKPDPVAEDLNAV